MKEATTNSPGVPSMPGVPGMPNVPGVLCACLLLAAAITAGAQEQRSPYKDVHKKAAALVVDGKADAAVTHLEAYLEVYPGDLESHFWLAAAYARKDDPEQAMDHVKEALRGGLPFDRFQAGPRGLLEPLTATEAFRALAQERGGALLHGPLLGCVTDRSARFWVRTAREAPVQVLVSDSVGMEFSADSASLAGSARGRTTAAGDFTTVIEVDRLDPGTRYFYQVKVDGGKDAVLRSFRTFPPAGKPARFRVGFGGGAGYTPWKEHMWDTIAAREPAAFLLLGDNVYIDNPKRPAVQRYCYYRRQSRPEFRRLFSSVPVYAIWDDHDFTTNDAWGGPDVDRPRWKRPVWRVFKENWNNPGYGGGERQPGCWFAFSLSDVEFIMLDGRFYRTSPKDDRPSMLGPLQKAWLKERLSASKAVFKVLASPVPWASGTKPGSRDTWDGYGAEREEIFSFIKENRIEGVVLLSADRHRSDVWKIDRGNGYALYEFESSRLTNVHVHKKMAGALFSYNEKCSFGLLDFDTTPADPEVTYRIVNIDNVEVHAFTLKRSGLTFEKTGR